MSLNKEILAKLEEAFLCAFTDEEAALYAGISLPTLQELNKNTAFKEWKELLKQYPSLMAKRNLIQSIYKGNIENSRWWLDKKNKLDELSESKEINIQIIRSIIQDHRSQTPFVISLD